ncbi:endospore germination permease [Bacillus sp. NEB1478]|uniref:GerAB/ArcD/ProY family transporter n=1 Tax=Bacillus sp. NEB1478 TaxID=3073816 RepID=UPI002873C59B|nr:endospore germination permease [Bacillus sp. NEB1478]WNB91035.1 endospore germination permease [Bacillus sp. NEB1478]
MFEKGIISIRQFTILVALYTVGTAILIIPSILAANAKQDVWLAGLIGLGIGLLLVLLNWSLSKRFHFINFAEIIEKVFGPVLGRIFSLIFFLSYVFILAVFVLRNIGDFMTTVMMVETPIEAIHLLFLIIVLYGVRLGLETFTRTTELFLPWLVILFVVLFFTLLPKMQIINLLPILENGMKPVLRSSVSLIVFPFLELILFLMIIPNVNQPEKTRGAYLLGTFLGGGILILISTLSILVMGVNETSRSIYPTFDLSKTINIREFFQRVEAFMALIWFITVYVKLIVLTYILCVGISHSLRIHDYKLLTFPIGLLMFVVSLVIFPSSSYLIEFTPIYDVYAIIWLFFFPLIIWVVSLIRGKPAAPH